MCASARITCGKSNTLSSEQKADKETTQKPKEMALSSGATVKKGEWVLRKFKHIRIHRTPVRCISSLCLYQRKRSASAFCPGSSCGICCGCRWCSSDTTSSLARSTPCCSTWQGENHRWVNTHSALRQGVHVWEAFILITKLLINRYHPPLSRVNLSSAKKGWLSIVCSCMTFACFSFLFYCLK